MYKLIMNVTHLYVKNPASQSSYTDVYAVIVCSSCMYALLDEKHFKSEKSTLESFLTVNVHVAGDKQVK